MEQTQGQPGTKPCYKSKYKTLITHVTLCIFLVSILWICFSVLSLHTSLHCLACTGTNKATSQSGV